MSASEIVDAILRFIELLTMWPVLLFLAVLLFRKQIGELIPALAERLKKVSIGGNSLEFYERVL